MAVGHTSDSASSGKLGTGTSFTFTSVAVSGTNPVLMVGVGVQSATATVSSVAVSAGLTSGTPVQVISRRGTGAGGGALTSIWALPAPSGTGTITVTLSTSVAWQGCWSLFFGADQTTPCPTGDAIGSTSTGTETLTPTNLTANDGSYGLGSDDHDDVNGVTPNQTYLDDTTTINLEAGYRLGTGGITFAFVASNLNMSKVAVRIVAATGGATVDVIPPVLGQPRASVFNQTY